MHRAIKAQWVYSAMKTLLNSPSSNPDEPGYNAYRVGGGTFSNLAERAGFEPAVGY
jgi:hypothetical protein